MYVRLENDSLLVSHASPGLEIGEEKPNLLKIFLEGGEMLWAALKGDIILVLTNQSERFILVIFQILSFYFFVALSRLI